ncbi:hypothetical protein ACFQ9R_28800 [Nocardia sp. NPDC056541]|uniref:hypothetical protein n=1 Tax=Nocardia sp. NPDC056541 TaxID=3345860 RepID=UPI0036700EED
MNVHAHTENRQSVDRESRRAGVTDVVALVAILTTTVALVVIVGPAAGVVLGAAGGFVAVTLKIFLSRR